MPQFIGEHWFSQKVEPKAKTLKDRKKTVGDFCCDWLTGKENQAALGTQLFHGESGFKAV